MARSQYYDEEPDIMRLEGEDAKNAKGWVNIGPYAVSIEMIAGDLTVEVHPRTNEGSPLAACNANAEGSARAGGEDPYAAAVDES